MVTQEIQQKLDELAESFAYKKDYAFKYWDNRDKELKAIAEQFGYDSFLAAEDGEWTLGLFSPDQAKSLTQGIGLMDRGNPDITFSMERNLAAVHTLSPEKFLAALELGGMPMPSVAVTRLDRPYRWGNTDAINLIGRPEMVDPEKGTEVFSADAWTGYVPRLVHKTAGKEDRSAASVDLYDIKNKYQDKKDGDNTLNSLDFKISEGEKTELYEMNEKLRSASGKVLFAWQSGYRPRPKMKDAVRTHEWLTREFAKELLEYTQLPREEYEKRMPEMDAAIKREVVQYYANKNIVKNAPSQEMRERRLNSWASSAMRAFWRDTPILLKQELGDVANIGKRVLDTQANLKMLEKYADKHKRAFETWVEEKLNKWYSKERYIAGTKKEATLDNITAYMLREKGKNKEAGFAAIGYGQVRAMRSQRLRSLEHIKEQREKLVDTETSDEQKFKTNELMNNWQYEAAQILNRNKTWLDTDVYDDLMRVLAELKGEPTAEKLRVAVNNKFRREPRSKVQELLNNAKVIGYGVEALKCLRKELEDYMEAVPQRAVKIDEWVYAVMPESLKKNKAVMAGLRENGIRLRFHDGTEEGRKAALAGLVNDSKVSFSVVGENAANWEEIKHLAFRGRDDGKLRVEIDASQAMFRSPSYRERVDEIKAFIEEQRELAVEDGRQRLYAEREARLDRLDEAMDSASEDEVSEILREYERIENERKDFRRKLYGEWRAVFPEIEMEEGDYLLLERAVLGEKGASRTNNAVFMLASMRDNLGITPVERALHPKLEADRETIVAALKRLKESEVAQELKAVYERTEAGERTEEMRARVEQLADDVRQEAVRLGVPERILRGKPWFRVHMELFERDAEDVADAALRTVLLEDVLDFPELYEAYPQLRDYRVYGDMLGSTAYRGMYDGWNAIVLNDMLGEQEVLGTLLHEVQHAIQKIEGFARGGNEDYANEQALLLESVDPEKYGWVLEKSPYELYRRLAGEVEARNVQKRVGYSAVEREMLPFNSTMDVPEYETLVSFSTQTVMADWSAVLDRFVVMPPMAGTEPYRKDLLVCPTPAVMQMVGAKGWDIVMSPSVLVKCLHKDTMLGNKKKLMEYYKGQKHEHDILLADMKQLPAALADPVCIVISDTPGCLEVVTELKEGDRNILVAIQLNSAVPGRNNAVKVNRVVSLYGKDKIEAILTHPRLYWNAAKARVWIKNGGLQSSTVVYQRRASGHKVLKPEDLVKYKMEKGLTYHTCPKDFF